MNEEQSRKKRYKLADICLIVLPPIILIIIWEICGRLDILNKSILPTPEAIVTAFKNLIEKGSLQNNLIVSGTRIGIGFFYGTMAGLVFGIATGLIPTLDKLFMAFVGILKPIPIISLIPFFILWLGIDEESKIAVIILGVFWPVFVNTSSGIKSVDKKSLEVAKIFRKSRLETLFKIIIPSASGHIFNGLRLAAGNALMCVVTAEMIAASSGIGYMIMFARELSQPAIMIVGIAVIGCFGLLIDLLFLKLQKRILK